MDNIRLFLIAIPALPLLSAIITAALGPRLLKKHSHLPTILALATSFVFSLLLLNQVISSQDQLEEGSSFERVYTLWTWADIDNEPLDASAPLTEQSSGDFRIDVTLRADSLTAIMLSMVTFVSTLVAIFAVGYMHGDRGYWRFFATVSLFVFSMTMLVSVSNFLLLYVFWEAVGVCSYLLIGFWYTKPSAAAAGKKAFLVNRVGDFGFALALFFIWTTYGTLDYHDTLSDGDTDQVAVSQALAEDGDVSNVAPGVLDEARMTGKRGAYVGGGIALAICLLLLTGACGKSAQFPLHVWLPDAMEGPTPVSALIHAATMVTAGVYMVARCTPLFLASPDALLIVAVIGGITALLAAAIALTQFDLKRVLAYSTVSQLGYMFLALGTGTLAGISSGMFHLLTHAFFKALLFLGAGSVMHAMGNVIDMRRFGGLRKKLPITHITFAVGCLALAGIFPLAGFWSKDAIVGSVHDKVHQLHEEGDQISVALTPETAGAAGMSLIDARTKASVYHLLYYVALIVAFMTAFYTFRAFFLTFYGREEIPREAAGHAHESPRVMWGPLAILAACAALVGIGLMLFGYESFLRFSPSLAMATGEGSFHMSVAAISTIVAVGGILAAAYLYLGDRKEVEVIRGWMSFQWITRLTDTQWVAKLRRLKPVAAVDRFLRAIKLGALGACIGYLLLLIIVLLAAPLLAISSLTPYRLSQKKFFIDEIYDVLIVRPLRILAAFCFWIDRWIVDGLVNTCGRIPPKVGSLMRSLQMGLVPFYALAMVLGALVLIAVRMVVGD